MCSWNHNRQFWVSQSGEQDLLLRSRLLSLRMLKVKTFIGSGYLKDLSPGVFFSTEYYIQCMKKKIEEELLNLKVSYKTTCKG